MIHQRYQQIYEYEKRHWWYAGRRFLLTLLLQKIKLKSSSTILDLGCGTGFNLSLLSQYGNTYGVDIAAQAISYCRRRGFTQVKQTDGKKLPFKDKYFDLIACLDVLEHIKRETETLAEVRRVLKPGGYFIAFVPAFLFLWSELDARSHHYRRYTISKFKKTLELNGFSVVHVGYFNYLFFVPILLVRLWQKTLFGKKTKWGFDPLIANFSINQLLTSIFYFDVWSALKAHPPVGVSLYALCSKKNQP